MFCEFSSLFDLCNTLSNSSIILGDLCVHFDIPTNPIVLKIDSLLNGYSFYQAVTVPTHKLGHTLHMLCVMFRPTDYIQLVLASCFFLIITVLSVTFLLSNLLTMLNMNCLEIYVA